MIKLIKIGLFFKVSWKLFTGEKSIFNFWSHSESLGVTPIYEESLGVTRSHSVIWESTPESQKYMGSDSGVGSGGSEIAWKASDAFSILDPLVYKLTRVGRQNEF
jgi:hypothetical protein